MSTSLKHIIIGEGLGELFFGMSRADIRRKLGDPTDIEIYEYIPNSGEMAESWHYDEYEISLTFFEEEADWQLETIAVSADDYLLDGVAFVGLSKTEAIQEIKNLELGDYTVESLDDNDELSQEFINLTNQNLVMWIDEGSVTEVQWEPLWDDE